MKILKSDYLYLDNEENKKIKNFSFKKEKGYLEDSIQYSKKDIIEGENYEKKISN